MFSSSPPLVPLFARFPAPTVDSASCENCLLTIAPFDGYPEDVGKTTWSPVPPNGISLCNPLAAIETRRDRGTRILRTICGRPRSL
jgi:hypothetical protein